MRTEAKKTFQHGFDLTEQELRRIFETMYQQIERSYEGCSPKVSFEIKFKNGVVADIATLDEIFTLENIGSKLVQRLTIRLDDGKQQPSSNVELKFIDVDNDSGPGYDSIAYTIIGDDRDWVFITSSQLDERISRTKKLALNQFVGKKNRLFQTIPMLIFMVVMIVSFVFLLPKVFNSMQYQGQEIDTIATKWHNGEYEDQVEVMLALERIRLETPDTTSFLLPFSLIVIIPLGVVLVFLGIIYFWGRYFPVYNFIWGDYIKFYEKRKSVGKFIVIGVIFTIIITIISNYISALFGIGK